MEHFPTRTILVYFHISLWSGGYDFLSNIKLKLKHEIHIMRGLCNICQYQAHARIASTKTNIVTSSEAIMASLACIWHINKYCGKYQQILWQISTSIVANVTTIVGFRGNHGLLGLQSGEDPACGSVPHAGRCSELKTWTYLGQCMILIFLGKKDAQQVKRADGALGKALALQAAGIQVFILWCFNS